MLTPSSHIGVRAALGALWLLVAACASQAPRPEAAPGTPAAERIACERSFAALDEAVAMASVQDAETARIQGFPYLRVDRFLMSYREQPMSAVQFEAWVDRLQALDQRARQSELANLPKAVRAAHSALAGSDAQVLDELARCGDVLRQSELSDSASWQRLRTAAVAPSEYQPFKRLLGLYPITAQFVMAGVGRLHKELKATFATPPEQLPVAGQLLAYVPPPQPTWLAKQEVAALLKSSANNPLTIPEPRGVDRTGLLARFAPIWIVDVTSDDDRPGRVEWRDSDLPYINTTRPRVYTRLSHTRFLGQVLLQLNYQIWFPARPRSGAFDILGGHLDGITWRVTLDSDGEPLIYDVIHNCGCYHMFFPGPRLHFKGKPQAFEEPLLIPSAAPLLDEGERVAVHVAHTTHYLERVSPAHTIAEREIGYRFADYHTLRSLPLPGAGHRSLFAGDGIVPGTQRGERWILWPMGIPAPGAMRQWGHHATAFVGRRHFDDPNLFERYFERVDSLQ